MVNNEKANNNLIMIIRSLLFIVWVIVIGGFLLLELVPSSREMFILATTVQPETFTELYFEDHLSLPGEVTLFKENHFKFTIHNLENKDMEYPYEVYIEENEKRQSIDKRYVLIKDNESKTIPVNFTITIPMQRAKVVVNLINKNQQIHFWMEE